MLLVRVRDFIIGDVKSCTKPFARTQGGLSPFTTEALHIVQKREREIPDTFLSLRNIRHVALLVHTHIVTVVKRL